MVNYLNPHTLEEGGKEVLYKFFSANPEVGDCEPTIFRFTKDAYFGDILLICTDGIYSEDQALMGKNAKGVWKKVEPKLIHLLEKLKAFSSSKKQLDASNLGKALSNYLEKLKAENQLDNDATLGVLITEKALKYFLK